jgi:hypothetical protein
VHSFHFQVSQWGSREEGQFTVNVGVGLPAVWEIMFDKPFPTNPATGQFPLSERIGLLMPERLDRWWQVDEATDLDEIADHVALCVQKSGLPFLDAWGSEASILSGLRSDLHVPGLLPGLKDLLHASLAARAGGKPEARQILAVARRLDVSLD